MQAVLAVSRPQAGTEPTVLVPLPAAVLERFAQPSASGIRCRGSLSYQAAGLEPLVLLLHGELSFRAPDVAEGVLFVHAVRSRRELLETLLVERRTGPDGRGVWRFGCDPLRPCEGADVLYGEGGSGFRCAACCGLRGLSDFVAVPVELVIGRLDRALPAWRAR